MLISGTFTVELLMKCSRCENVFFSRHSVLAQRDTADEVERIAKLQMPNIPIGWAMNGRHDIRCPEHF